MTESDGRSLVRYFVTGVLIVVAAATATCSLHSVGMLDRWENNNLDRWLLTKEPEQSNAIVLVVIDDADYEGPFGGRSPLDEVLVADLVRTIARASPKVIGVDLDTSSWSEATSSDLTRIRVPIVWARDAWRDDKGDYRLSKVLGSDNRPGVCSGVPAMYVDADGVVRRAYAGWTTAEWTLPSFSTLVAGTYRGSSPCDAARVPARATSTPDEGHGETRINFLQRGYAFKRFNAGAVKALARTDTWATDEDFHRKAVLVGGTYRTARDRYPTSVGLMDGVELAAQVAQNQIAEGPVFVVSHSMHFFVDLAVGCVVLGLLACASTARKLAVLSLTALGAFIASLTLFHTTAYFFSFVPVLVGLAIHETIELLVENRKLHRKNVELNVRLGLAGNDRCPPLH